MKRTLTAAICVACVAGMASAQYDMKAPQAEKLAAELPEFEKPALWFGSQAPGMHIAEWTKGSPVTEFESGKVYVVEFWATWCGPCIKAFPHLTELQKEYGDKVQIVGVNIWDQKEDESQSDRNTRVAQFVEKQGERMGYTVAIEDDAKMAEAWMEAAQRNGIPSAFIVNGEGRIAWMGHPTAMDKPLAQIVAGSYDHKPHAKETAKAMHSDQLKNKAMKEIAEGDADKGYKLANKLVDGPLADDAYALNQIAWVTLTEPGFTPNPEFSIKAASRACELTEWQDGAILDTLARAYYENGDLDHAIKYQKKAVAHAEGEMKTELEKVLTEYLEKK